jgi:D-psicose/D-tagatose/L-ribulose 3-epimerase
MDVRLSCTTWTFEPKSVLESIPQIRDLGFQGVDIPVASHLDPDKTSGAQRSALRQAVSRAGLTLSGLHWAIPQGLSYSTPDAGIRTAAVEYFKQVIDLAEDLGVHAITLGCGYTHRISPEWDRREALMRARESWEQWAMHLEGKQVRVGLEVLSRIDVNVLNTVEECLGFLQGLLGPRLGLTLDTYHMNIEEPEPAAAILQAGRHIQVFQIAENHRNAPGTGHLPWRQLFSMLRLVNYTGYVSFEVPPLRWGSTEPRDAMRELGASIAFVNSVLRSV